MEITFEQYLTERLKIWDETKVFSDTFIDEDSGKLVDYYKSDYEKIDVLIKELDKKYENYFIGDYILYKRNELDKWIPYKIMERHIIDSHNSYIEVMHIGKNFKENNHKKLFFRKGVFKSITEDDVKIMFNWHKKEEKQYETKYLYIFKNEIGRIKIGQATNVEQRIEALILQSGINIKILNKIKNSAKYERILHALFKTKRHIGEWFILNDNEINWLCSLNEINIDIKINNYNK